MFITNEFIFFFHILVVLSAVLSFAEYGLAGLTTYMTFIGICANLFVTKQIMLFGMEVTAVDVFTVGGVLTCSLIQEWYGKEAAHQAIKVSGITMLLFIVFSNLHLLYFPSSHDTMHMIFEKVCAHTPRIMGSSLIVMMASQYLFTILYERLKLYGGGSSLSVLFITTAVVQAFDTICFSFMALYGIVASLQDVMIISYTIKIIAIAFSTPLVTLLHRFFPHESTI